MHVGSSLQVFDSELVDNDANLWSAGIHFSPVAAVGASYIQRSTIARNGAGKLASYGGGLYQVSGELRIDNSTFSGNRAELGGAIYSKGGTAALNLVTVAENQSTKAGGVLAKIGLANAFTLSRSIVYDNAGGDCSSLVSSLGGNVVENCVSAIAGDRVGQDPRLAPLGQNGGPTLTHALAKSSIAIDWAGGCIHFRDQRSFSRPELAGCDAGAFEVENDGETPHAIDDFFSLGGLLLHFESAPGVLGNDVDPNGDALVAHLMSSPAHGTLTLNPDGSFQYQATDLNFPVDKFTYRVTDGIHWSNIATVTLDRITPDEAGIPWDRFEFVLELPWSGLLVDTIYRDGDRGFLSAALGTGVLQSRTDRRGTTTLVIAFATRNGSLFVEIVLDARGTASLRGVADPRVQGQGVFRLAEAR